MADVNEFTLEKLRIVEKLSELEKTVIRFEGAFKSHCELDAETNRRIADLLEHHETLLMGKDGKPGLVIIIDRMTQRDKRVDASFKLIIGMMVALLVKVIYDAIQWVAFRAR